MPWRRAIWLPFYETGKGTKTAAAIAPGVYALQVLAFAAREVIEICISAIGDKAAVKRGITGIGGSACEDAVDRPLAARSRPRSQSDLVYGTRHRG
ncbi:MAG: hypothetical protein U1F27_06390 [Turneriella sp.]